MELNELQNIWEREHELLHSRISVNEKLIKNMNLDKVISTYRMFLNISLVGRSLALVYGIISMAVGIKYLGDLAYSLPVLLGGILMFWSFYHHLAIKKPKNYHNLSVTELQKSIEKFRIHSIKSKRYDILVAGFWLTTLLLIFLKMNFDIDIYTNSMHLLIGGAVLMVILGIVYLVSHVSYKMYDESLKESEFRLSKIRQFEQE